MSTLIVVENPKSWPFDVGGAEIVAARDYLTQHRFSDLRRARVFNLCRTYSHQTVGYYVSLLAEGRGHRPMPSVTTMQDLRFGAILRMADEELRDRMAKVLPPTGSSRLEFRVYFGRTIDESLSRLGRALFNYFPAPFLRAEFERGSGWRLANLSPIAASEIPAEEQAFAVERMRSHFQRPISPPATETYRYELAILWNPSEVDAPSDEGAIQRFSRAARSIGLCPTLISRDDFGRVAEFDALFIRETTAVDHHTYRFARRAEAEDLVVIDSVESILRCTNKVYLAEAFERHQIPSPRTLVVHQGNGGEIAKTLGLPCVLKRPDSSFSLGVVKAETEDELRLHLEQLFSASELVVAQEYTPSEFDWRIGVLAGKPLYACRYFMARGHWQVQRNLSQTRRRYGRVETVAVDEAPDAVVELALRAAAVIGDGLYGVDIKDLGDRLVVMEVNDNPSIEAGCEDAVLKDELYLAIAREFLARLDSRGRRG